MISFTPTFWLLVFLVFLVAELVTMGLSTIWFAIGALASLCVNLFGLGFWPQVIAFIAVSFVTLIVTRPFAMKYLKKNYVKTNVDEIPGTVALVTESIDNLKGTGRVMIRGVDWRAVTESDDVIIEVGKKVEILSIQGVKVIVKEKKED